MRKVYRLVHKDVRQRAVDAVLSVPDGYLVTIKEPARTDEQNAQFHAICSDLERSDLVWAGERRTKDQWKVLLISGHAVATKQGSQMVPGIEGEFVNIRESSALMSKTRGSSLIEYAIAFCAVNGVKLHAIEE